MFSTFLLIVSIVGRVLPFQYQDYDDHWGYSLGDDWDVSDDIAATNPYYNTWQQLSAQMDHHALAQHMGKINHQQHNPCKPNPCSKYPYHNECVAVNAHTAKCSPCGDYQLVLSWTGATGNEAEYDLFLVPVKKKGGTLCDTTDFVDSVSDDVCGTEPGEEDADGTGTASVTHTLTTNAVDQGQTSSYRDYIYQIFLHLNPDVKFLNPDVANPFLTVKYKGVKVADFAMPTGKANGAGLDDANAYFFGCFVPLSNTCGNGYINQGGSGFYDTYIAHATRSHKPVGKDFVTGTTLRLGDAGLCSATRILE